MRVLISMFLCVGSLLALEIDMSNPSAILATAYGAEASENCGTDIALGDVNGDGIADLVFNASRANIDRGRVYILFGGSGFGGNYYMTGDADVTINGIDELDNIFEIALGDFNGDGMKDILIGVSNGDGLGNAYTNAGEAYIFYGRTSWPSSMSLSSANVYIYNTELGGGDPDGSAFLGSMLAAPNLNGDAYDDIVLSATGANYGSRIDAGCTYVIWGSASLPGTIQLPGGANAAFYNPDSYDMHQYTSAQYLFRAHTLGKGNLNGDSYEDLIIGLYLGDGPGNARKDAGELHIVLGSPSLSGSYDLATWPHPVIYGADTGDWLSRHCSGDVNGDGFDDILANASRSASLGNARPSAGEIYLILGRASWPSSLDMAAGDYRCVFYGAESGDWMDVSAIGDATGDGAPDIIVGGVMADGPGNGRPNCGELNLFRWSNSLPSVIDLLTDTPLVYIYAPQAYDTMGIYSACLVGDPDANGRPNIIVGAAKSTRLGLSGNGQVFVLSYPLELAADESAGGSERFTLIPRPGGFRLVLPEGYSGQVSVYDASGRQIASETVSESWEISLSSGVYLVRAQGLGTGKIAVR
ncbi:MAG: hypothetical protein ABIN66_07435 [candidate division WOR-3 bacterium]